MLPVLAFVLVALRGAVRPADLPPSGAGALPPPPPGVAARCYYPLIVELDGRRGIRRAPVGGGRARMTPYPSYRPYRMTRSDAGAGRLRAPPGGPDTGRWPWSVVSLLAVAVLGTLALVAVLPAMGVQVPGARRVLAYVNELPLPWKPPRPEYVPAPPPPPPPLQASSRPRRRRRRRPRPRPRRRRRPPRSRLPAADAAAGGGRAGAAGARAGGRRGAGRGRRRGWRPPRPRCA